MSGAPETQATNAPLVRGWCPGAHRPMMSGDGLVVRVRPFRAALTAAQALALFDLSQRFGNGVLDLTSRANLQLRGVAEADHAGLLQELDALGLIDADPAVEGHRNILLPPERAEGDLTDRLYDALLTGLAGLSDLPDALPGKMGFAIDTGPEPCLREGSADFRFELNATGQLLLRADGADRGFAVDEAEAIAALREMAVWFVASGGREAGRMARHLKRVALPERWARRAPRGGQRAYAPGDQIGQGQRGPLPAGTGQPDAASGVVLGAAFGKLPAAELRRLIEGSGASGLRLMLGRMFALMGAGPGDVPPGPFLSQPDPLLAVHACPGAPFCPQAEVETMSLAQTLARSLARKVAETPDGQPASGATALLHVSGCAKGCALAKPAMITLTGRDGLFDLIEQGCAWDTPRLSGLTPEALETELTRP